MVQSKEGQPTAVVQDLPDEMALAMCQNLDVDDLRNLRCSVLPTATSARKCLELMENSRLRDLVTRISFSTPSDPESLTWGSDNELHMPSEVESVLASIAEFAKLQHIDLKFWKQDDHWGRPFGNNDYMKFAEIVNFRARLLHQLLRVIADESSVTGLRLDNLQNDLAYVPGHYLSPHDSDLERKSKDLHSLLRRVLARLDCLEISTALNPEVSNDFDNFEYHFFNTTLPRHILKYATNSLRTLTLFGNTYWGYHPYFDYSALHFPRLKNLTLKRLSFAFDAQLDWVLSHKDTLESLILDDCPIILGGLVTPLQPHHPAEAPPLRQIEEYKALWTYQARWYSHFQAFAEGLPYLRFFAFASGDSHDCYDFEDGCGLGLRLGHSRYCVFNGATLQGEAFCRLSPDQGRTTSSSGLRSRWQGTFHDATNDIALPNCGKEDENALQGLIDAIAKRVGGHKLMIQKVGGEALRDRESGN